ncbi:restriction endonuclease [Leisingera sp. McT4-56]|uniref:restriction endonuclease n=1 Tax=Leisingera sp. McT4-56 TaxID=2881255 RepID=UPI001CF8D8AD|nr:restriction endonuclease [Leisingera sp. McT4-56]
MSKQSSYRSRVARAFAFEDLVAEIFKQLGYKVRQDVRFGRREVDLVVESRGKKIPVEVSALSGKATMNRITASANRLLDLVVEYSDFERPIIVVGAELSQAAKEWTAAQNKVHVWDLTDLHSKVGAAPQLQKRLQKFSDDALEDRVQKGDLDNSLKKKLSEHIADQSTLSPQEYERFCMSVMKELFAPHLYGFKKQAQTSDGGNRYDFICRILPGNEFWDSLRQDFRTKAILFECKNYSKKIGPDQVYSTERYLFSGALRTVCLLISRLGPDPSAIRAAQGAMRETGKLIILLSNQDLIDMLDLRSQEGAVEDFLDERIWDFIVSLPR